MPLPTLCPLEYLVVTVWLSGLEVGIFVCGNLLRRHAASNDKTLLGRGGMAEQIQFEAWLRRNNRFMSPRYLHDLSTRGYAAATTLSYLRNESDVHNLAS